MTEFNSAAAAFAQKGRSVEDDMAESLGVSDDDTDETDEDYSEIKDQFRQGNHEKARLLAARVIGNAEDETVEAAREELSEVIGEVDYEAHPNTISGHVSAMQDEAADGNRTTVVRLAIQVVKCINNGVGY
jgi:hypothetical protein